MCIKEEVHTYTGIKLVGVTYHKTSKSSLRKMRHIATFLLELHCPGAEAHSGCGATSQQWITSIYYGHRWRHRARAFPSVPTVWPHYKNIVIHHIHICIWFARVTQSHVGARSFQLACNANVLRASSNRRTMLSSVSDQKQCSDGKGSITSGWRSLR